MQKERTGKPSPFSSDNCRPRKALASGEGQPSQTLKNTPKREPRLHRYYSALCVRACVGVCVCARADAQVAGKPPLPLWVFQFPSVLRARQMGGGDARWRQPRTPAPAYRCSTARPGEWRGDQRWSGLAKLACAGRAADFSQRAERPKHLGTD